MQHLLGRQTQTDMKHRHSICCSEHKRACASRDSLSTLSPSLALCRCSSRAASNSARASASAPAQAACVDHAQRQADSAALAVAV